MARNERALFGILYFGSIWLWKWVFGWYGWESFYAIALAVPVAFVLGLAAEAIRDTWPREVPYDLKGQVAAYEDAGWHLTRTHPWWQCHGRAVAGIPHVHMMQGGQLMIVAVKPLLPDARLES